MTLERERYSDESIGSLRSCLVEGDPEQLRRERKIRRRALLLSILVQTCALAALLLYPLLGKSEKISPPSIVIVPPFAPGRAPHQNPSNPHPHGDGKRICIVCFGEHGLPPILKPGERIGSTFGEPDGDPIPGFPTGPGVPGGWPMVDRRPEKPREETKPTNGRQRISEGVQMAQLIHRVEPAYPILAKQTGREGRVELHTIIATDDSIQSLEVISGDPLLVRSALEAVREWRYRPTILNGNPVEVDTHITVIYALNR